jgi:alanine dehydrogenase
VSASLGIRREDKHQWEARVPLTPNAVRELTAQGVAVVVQPSTIRVYDDDAYRDAGAVISEDLSSCNTVIAVKEIPTKLLRQDGVYMFFSHTIKGQKHNMPMLRRLMDLGCTLIDYERIVDDKGRRLVFFGRHAGLAGMIDTFHVLGQRLAALGTITPFADVKLSHHYRDLDEARSAVAAVGARLATEPLPESLAPLIVGFAGYGNVSQGAQDILGLLPIEEVAVADLAQVPSARDRLFKVVFHEHDLVEPLEGNFELQEYYDHPERYRSVFEQHARKLSVLVNAIYWTDSYPRLLSNEFVRELFLSDPRLLLVGDISCDIDGAVQCTVKATTPGVPAYVYEPATGSVNDGVQGPGLAMMTTDCLPCELPRESSASFTEALAPFVPPIAALVPQGAFEDAAIPPEIARATILWRGELTPDYRYIAEHLDA